MECTLSFRDGHQQLRVGGACCHDNVQLYTYEVLPSKVRDTRNSNK